MLTATAGHRCEPFMTHRSSFFPKRNYCYAVSPALVHTKDCMIIPIHVHTSRNRKALNRAITTCATFCAYWPLLPLTNWTINSACRATLNILQLC